MTKQEPFFQTKYWHVFLSQDQTYLGRCVVVLRRETGSHGSISDLTAEEILDWCDLVRRLETAMVVAFGATMSNWSCLMNNAWRDNEIPHVHWHFRPRYKNSFEVDGRLFEDPNFGEHYLSGVIQGVGSQTMAAIESLYRVALG